MHILSALDSSWHTPSGASENVGTRRWYLCPCLPGGPSLRQDFAGHKMHIWCMLSLLVGSSVLCVGMFESTRLTTYVLRSPCTIVSTDIVDVGTCTLCDNEEPANCEVYPVATARIGVTFRPLHSDRNITGWVWYCKSRASVDTCQRHLKGEDQLALDFRAFGGRFSQAQAGSPLPISCSTGEIFRYVQMHKAEQATECYYSSRDPAAEDVWLTMPSPGIVDHQWFQKHMEYPVLLALGGLVLLGTLLTCLALEGVELWASGLL